MMFDLRRRNLLAGGAALLGLPNQARAQKLPTLRATHLGGPYQVLQGIIGQPFEDAKFAHVVYEVETSPTAITKLQNQRGDPPFDVVIMSRSFALRALNAGLLQKI